MRKLWKLTLNHYCSALCALGLLTSSCGKSPKNNKKSVEVREVNNSIEQVSVENLLFDAIQAGDLALTKQAVIEGARIDVIQDGESALGLATRLGHSQIISYLLISGADVNLVLPNGNTALLVAILNDREQIALDLLTHGADARLIGNNQNDPLLLSINRGQIRVARRIIENNPEVSNLGEVLSAARAQGMDSLVEILEITDRLGNESLAQESVIDLLKKQRFESIQYLLARNYFDTPLKRSRLLRTCYQELEAEVRTNALTYLLARSPFKEEINVSVNRTIGFNAVLEDQADVVQLFINNGMDLDLINIVEGNNGGENRRMSAMAVAVRNLSDAIVQTLDAAGVSKYYEVFVHGSWQRRDACDELPTTRRLPLRRMRRRNPARYNRVRAIIDTLDC